MSQPQTQPTPFSQGLAGAPLTRVLHVFTVPPSLVSYGIKSFGIVELNAEEEIMAGRRVRGDQIRLAWELAKESLRQIDGKNVGTSDGSSDTAWQTMHPKMRQLVLTAYSEVHTVKETDVQGFLKSHEVQVG